MIEVRLSSDDLATMARLGIVVIITDTQAVRWELPPREGPDD